MTLVTVKQKKLPFALIRPVKTSPREQLYLIVSSSTCVSDIEHWWKGAKGPVAVDLETTGLNAHDSAQYVVGISLCDDRGAVYVDVSDNQKLFQEICAELYRHNTPLIAHNASFDAAWMTRALMTELNCWTHTDWMDSDPYYTKWIYHNWFVCTYAAYKHLASEGFENQSHGLASVIKDVLNWNEDKGDLLYQWLAEHGYTKKKIPERLLKKLEGR